MRHVKLFFILLLSLISSVSFAKNQVIYFEPNSVEVSGVIKILTFPGAPNYESVKKGDAAEAGAYLILDKPVDVDLESKSSSSNEPEKNVKIFQLVVENKKDWKELSEGSYVNVTGTLSHALTGHHHARILLTVNKIKMISKHKLSHDDLDITTEDREFMRN